MAEQVAAAPKVAKKPSKPKAPAAHPETKVMVIAAVTALKDRKGSSLQAIKKYIKANYNVGENYDSHIKKCVKTMVAKGALSQTKGKGANGSFKLDNKSVKSDASKAKKAEKDKAKKVAQKEKDKAKKAAKKAKLAAKKAAKPKSKKVKKTKSPKKAAVKKVVKKTVVKKAAKPAKKAAKPAKKAAKPAKKAAKPAKKAAKPAKKAAKPAKKATKKAAKPAKK